MEVDLEEGGRSNHGGVDLILQTKYLDCSVHTVHITTHDSERSSVILMEACLCCPTSHHRGA